MHFLCKKTSFRKRCTWNYQFHGKRIDPSFTRRSVQVSHQQLAAANNGIYSSMSKLFVATFHEMCVATFNGKTLVDESMQPHTQALPRCVRWGNQTEDTVGSRERSWISKWFIRLSRVYQEDRLVQISWSRYYMNRNTFPSFEMKSWVMIWELKLKRVSWTQRDREWITWASFEERCDDKWDISEHDIEWFPGSIVLLESLPMDQ